MINYKLTTWMYIVYLQIMIMGVGPMGRMPHPHNCGIKMGFMWLRIIIRREVNHTIFIIYLLISMFHFI